MENLLIPYILAIQNLHLRAAGLHLRLSAFFDDYSTKNYQRDLQNLYFATTSFLNSLAGLESIASPTIIGGSISLLNYASNYILQLTVAAGVTLLKLLNSFFAKHIDFEAGKQHFHKTIWAIRRISVRQNDLPSRLAEVLAQMWK